MEGAVLPARPIGTLPSWAKFGADQRGEKSRKICLWKLLGGEKTPSGKWGLQELTNNFYFRKIAPDERLLEREGIRESDAIFTITKFYSIILTVILYFKIKKMATLKWMISKVFNSNFIKLTKDSYDNFKSTHPKPASKAKYSVSVEALEGEWVRCFPQLSGPTDKKHAPGKAMKSNN